MYSPQFFEESALLDSYAQYYILSNSTNGILAGHNNRKDNYLFTAGHDQDIVTEYAANVEQADTLKFTGASAEHASFTKHYGDLIIHAYGAEDAVTVSNYFSSTGYRYFNFAFDDKTLTLADIEAMNMTVNGTVGNDTLNGWFAADTITGGAGNDTLTGLEGDDILTAGVGNDTLSGNEGHDTLDGGTGNDKLYGGYSESDIYLFTAGHGQDIVTEYATNAEQADTLKFTGASAEHARFTKHDGDLIIHAYGAEDAVTVSNYFSSTDYRYFNFTFDDKTLTLADIEAMNMTVNGTAANDSLNGWYAADTITGGAGNDTLSGNEGHDTLDGGAGNDRLYGVKGSDIYLFAKGHNQDDVTDSMQNADDIDSIQFTDASVQDLWFSRSNSHLLISEIGSNDSVTLDNWFSGSAWQNKVISVADGQSLEATQLQQLVDAMAVFAVGQSVTAMQPDQMRASMQMINSSDYWSHS